MRYDAIVIGAGVAGVSAARALAARGLNRVLVLEKGIISGQGATPRAAGAVFSSSWSVESIHLALRSQAILADLAGRSGGAFSLVRPGYMLLISDIQRPFAEFIAAAHVDAGGAARLIEPDQVKALYPAVRVDDIDAGLHIRDDAVVHPVQMAMALAAAARSAGVEFFEGAPVERLALKDGRVTGVVLRGETVAAPHVVLAAGMGARRLMQASGLEIPLKPFRTQCSVVPTPDGLGLPCLTDVVQGMYGCPRVQGGYLFGYGTQTEQVPEEGWNPEQDPDEEEAALERLYRRVPGLAGVRPAGGWAGICDITPDSMPLLGPYRLQGLYALCGLAGHGLNRAPAAGEVVADLVAGRPPSLPVHDYLAARYGDYAGEDWPVTFGGPWRISVSRQGG